MRRWLRRETAVAAPVNSPFGLETQRFGRLHTGFGAKPGANRTLDAQVRGQGEAPVSPGSSGELLLAIAFDKDAAFRGRTIATQLRARQPLNGGAREQMSEIAWAWDATD